MAYESNIRMNRWLGIFKKHCVELFEKNSEECERNAIQNSNLPHQLHSKLLIGATQKMFLAMQEGHVKDKTTLSKINSWHEINNSMENI